jgi:hypothetical protein
MGESCSMCGGDGRISNAMGGSDKTCPSCHGTGRRMEDEGFRDVTKTKPSHHRPTNRTGAPVKATWPSTATGSKLAAEVRDSACSEQLKARLTTEIMEYETSHGTCTQTFIKKIRKQLRPRALP